MTPSSFPLILRGIGRRAQRSALSRRGRSPRQNPHPRILRRRPRRAAVLRTAACGAPLKRSPVPPCIFTPDIFPTKVTDTLKASPKEGLKIILFTQNRTLVVRVSEDLCRIKGVYLLVSRNIRPAVFFIIFHCRENG